MLVSNKLYPLGSPVVPGCVDPHMGLEHFGLQVDDFDQAVADLKAKGVEFLMEPHEFRAGSGFKIAFIKMPHMVSDILFCFLYVVVAVFTKRL